MGHNFGFHEKWKHSFRGEMTSLRDKQSSKTKKAAKGANPQKPFLKILAKLRFSLNGFFVFSGQVGNRRIKALVRTRPYLCNILCAPINLEEMKA